ncbi:hypothetical protein BDM02DRAFT_3130613 [Thelephora ganbajun]|uniref:Uncharacterized protein n=1 Tax=Thelephora ganbajun TaxID=370292 RepID=A0ACB6Z8U1_THEGA|nr:hypothetical protein BDM02DRAFT_3130613 [Thelephora ganbajun]
MTTSSCSRGADSRKSTLVLCVNLSHVRELAQTFRDVGIDARHVYSKTPAPEQKLLVEGFRAGEYVVLVDWLPLPLHHRHKPDALESFNEGSDRWIDESLESLEEQTQERKAEANAGFAIGANASLPHRVGAKSRTSYQRVRFGYAESEMEVAVRDGELHAASASKG